ncbi:hypothetical protein [Phycicoccus duodecadis]|uniref:hypothetical protein n=1 Tax=Phycicoccus duodecadis TaxID=173053 RepID=UPI000C70D705|nr:hypothetical protein [Phycicoccus duodecadis]
MIVDQLQLPIPGVRALSLAERLEEWLDASPVDSADGLVARLFLQDRATRRERARRWGLVRDIETRHETGWGQLFHGGLETMWLVHESALCLIRGQSLASLMCAHAACERHLAGILSISDDLPERWERWGLGRLMTTAADRGVITQELLSRLSALNEARKVSAHFKAPLHKSSLMARAQLAEDLEPDVERRLDAIAESDALEALDVALTLVHSAVWP